MLTMPELLVTFTPNTLFVTVADVSLRAIVTVLPKVWLLNTSLVASLSVVVLTVCVAVPVVVPLIVSVVELLSSLLEHEVVTLRPIIHTREAMNTYFFISL